MKTSDSIFINLSNHPIAIWPEEQFAAAKAYGDVIDMDFPYISPLASEEDIRKLAQHYLQLIIEHHKYSCITVHIMGEMTFTFALITLLKQHNISCVASCTERIVEEINGKKISEFHFRRFREY